MHRYAAPWSPLLMGLTLASTLLLLAVSLAAAHAIPAAGAAHLVGIGTAALPLLVIAGAVLFVVTGYEIDAHELRVQRLLWQTRIPLAGLHSATLQPALLRASIRTFGNGGLFSFSGWYDWRGHGRYRAFITSWENAIVLETGHGRIAISPADAKAFLQTLRMRYPGVTTV